MNRADEGVSVRLASKHRNAFFLDGRSIYANEEENFPPHVAVGDESLDHRHMFPKGQPEDIRLLDFLQSEQRLEVIGGKSETILVAQDHDAHEM